MVERGSIQVMMPNGGQRKHSRHDALWWTGSIQDKDSTFCIQDIMPYGHRKYSSYDAQWWTEVVFKL